jgi:hypothetical protein
VVGLVSIHKTIRQTVERVTTHARKSSSVKREPASVEMVRLRVVGVAWISKAIWRTVELAANCAKQASFATQEPVQSAVMSD